MFDYASRDFHSGLYIRIPDDGGSPSPTQVLWSGNTAHGMQVSVGELRRAPTTHFAEESGVGLALQNLAPRGRRHVGVVGLGIGTLAAYGESGDRMRFYEIDPRVARVAKGRFTYLRDSAADVAIVLGDARLSLERETPQHFDALVLDAFTGDAIPVHLLTREAFEIYLKHLRPGGVIAVHISNRHLDLRPVLAALGAEFEMETRLIQNEKGEERWWVLESTWVVMTRDPEFLEIPAIASEAEPIGVSPLLWTDERASLLPVLGRWVVEESDTIAAPEHEAASG